MRARRIFTAAQANVSPAGKIAGLPERLSPRFPASSLRATSITVRSSPPATAVKASPLFRVAQTDTFRIYVTVPQTNARSVAAGQSAAVSFREIPEKTFDAKVVRTAGALDPASRTLLTELQVANTDGQLFPGMYAEVKFAFPQDARTLLVPGNAVTGPIRRAESA